MFRHYRLQFACGFIALLTILGLVAMQIVHPSAAHAATNQFHGVNWADPNDNFVTGNLVPVG
ncbi:MAG TPA: cellulase, partial [Ktedonobacteraceae bacterium]